MRTDLDCVVWCHIAYHDQYGGFLLKHSSLSQGDGMSIYNAFKTRQNCFTPLLYLTLNAFLGMLYLSDRTVTLALKVLTAVSQNPSLTMMEMTSVRCRGSPRPHCHITIQQCPHLGKYSMSSTTIQQRLHRRRSLTRGYMYVKLAHFTPTPCQFHPV